jgi:hypothetical protein
MEILGPFYFLCTAIFGLKSIYGRMGMNDLKCGKQDLRDQALNGNSRGIQDLEENYLSDLLR